MWIEFVQTKQFCSKFQSLYTTRMKILCCFLVVVGASSALAQSSSCGGLLEADAGEYEFPPGETIQSGKVCVWIVKLISRQTVRFNLKQLGPGLVVSLYREHSPSQLSILPTRLYSYDVGRSVDANGQTLIVVLTQSGWGRGFAFKWDSLSSVKPNLLTAANYIEKESGHVLWNRFSSRERLTLSLNAEQYQSLDVEANANFRDCNLLNHCECSYVAAYELRYDGYLREISIACGRKSIARLNNLFPNILIFVYLNSAYYVSPSDYAELKWSISNSDASTTDHYEPSSSQPTWSTEDSTSTDYVTRTTIHEDTSTSTSTPEPESTTYYYTTYSYSTT